MFLKKMILFSNIALVSPITLINTTVNQSCDDYFPNGKQEISNEDYPLYRELYLIIDAMPLKNTWAKTTKSNIYAREIGKVGDYVTPNQMGIVFDFDIKKLDIVKAERYIGHKITVNLNLIKSSLRIAEINDEKGEILLARKTSYKHFCFYYLFGLRVYNFKK